MTDDELKALVARLRHLQWGPSGCVIAADAIEALMAERDEWKDATEAYAKDHEVMVDEVVAAEARAERAEAALRSLLALSETMFSDREEPRIARAVLAQIEKETGRET